MDKEYYVYEYVSNDSKEIITSDDKCIFIKKGTPFYVGKGKGNRVTTGIRNLECEKFKKELGWEYNIKKDKLSEEEALNFEKELIQKYLDNEIYLTNCLSGNSSQADIETLRIIKYILMLIDNEIIKMSQEQIALETESYTSIVSNIRTNKDGKFSKLKPKCPDNIKYILQEYDFDKISDKDLKYANIKYVLDLIDKGIKKATQTQVAEYFSEHTTVTSGIKKGKYTTVTKSIKPENLDEILLEFDLNKLTLDEKNKGSIMYIVKNFIDTGILKMTMRDLVRETKEVYNINEMQIADMRRRSVGLKLIKPSGEIIGKLFEKYYFSDEEMINL